MFNSLPGQRSGPHLGADDRLVAIDRILDHASFGGARGLVPLATTVPFDRTDMAIPILHGGLRVRTDYRVTLRRYDYTRPSSRTVPFDRLVDRLLVIRAVRRYRG